MRPLLETPHCVRQSQSYSNARPSSSSSTILRDFIFCRDLVFSMPLVFLRQQVAILNACVTRLFVTTLRLRVVAFLCKLPIEDMAVQSTRCLLQSNTLSYLSIRTQARAPPLGSENARSRSLRDTCRQSTKQVCTTHLSVI